MTASSKLRDEIEASGFTLAEIARRADIALTTLHTFVSKDGAEMRTSNFEKVSAALANLRSEASKRRPKGVHEDTATYAAGDRISVTVAITPDQAQAFDRGGVNVEAVVRAGAETALKEAEAKVWADANRDAIDSYNKWIEKHGTLAGQLGLI